MFRKISLLVSIVAVFSMALLVSAGDSQLEGCYIDAPAEVNEGNPFTVTVTCTQMTDEVFGFQFETDLNGYATTGATSFTAGDFVGANPVLVGINDIDSDTFVGEYAVTRQSTNTATGSFDLGSFGAVANKYLLSADDSATIDFTSLILTDNAGQSLGELRQAEADATVIIRDVDLALLTGEITVASDGYVTKLSDVVVSLNSSPLPTAQQLSGSSVAVDVGSIEYGDDTSDDSIALNVEVDMVSHLSCSVLTTLLDGDVSNTAQDRIGTGGTLVLYAGDVVTASDHAIDMDDADAVALYFGSAPTGEVDINQDGEVDILDLAHIGRNYGESSTTCG